MKIEASRFYATGLSIVLHPKNPYAPIIHMNLRYFELNDTTFWFGGGIDLTPHYVNTQEAARFHQCLKSICDAHAKVADYEVFKSKPMTTFTYHIGEKHEALEVSFLTDYKAIAFRRGTSLRH